MSLRRNRPRGTRRIAVYLAIIVAVLVLPSLVYFYSQPGPAKPTILYVDQGNGVVNGSNFGSMLSFASSHGFNTIFFQVYRKGVLLFGGSELSSFVNQTHAHGQKIFFTLYFTNSSQAIPQGILALGQDGVSLDMSALSLATQETLLQDLTNSCRCQTAVTTTDMASPLKPDLLVLETYGTALQQYVRHGIVASVGVFATSGQQDYRSQFQYALSNSDGVMVFDYAGLLRSGY
jgi:hypothetical protein